MPSACSVLISMTLKVWPCLDSVLAQREKELFGAKAAKYRPRLLDYQLLKSRMNH
jgi:hypothetical protein